MRNLRWTIPTLVLAALLAAGCILVSGQFIVSYDLPDPVTISSPADVQRANVDLNTVSTYRDHKSDLKGLSDVAILGEFTNTGDVPVSVELWMTPALTDLGDAASVITAPGAVKVWGPLRLAVDATTKITWDQSAALFQSGKTALLTEIKGDGVFTLYALGASGDYSFRIDHGVLVAVIDAGK